MPLFSAFTKFGNGFAFSGAPSHGERFYRMLLSLIGEQSYSTEEGTRMRVRTRDNTNTLVDQAFVVEIY